VILALSTIPINNPANFLLNSANFYNNPAKIAGNSANFYDNSAVLHDNSAKPKSCDAIKAITTF